MQFPAVGRQCGLGMHIPAPRVSVDIEEQVMELTGRSFHFVSRATCSKIGRQVFCSDWTNAVTSSGVM